jgi:MtfA peptidase
MMSWFHRWRSAGQSTFSLDERQKPFLQLHVPAYARLAPTSRDRYEIAVAKMSARRNWEGCEGLKVIAEMRLLVSAHAAFMLLGTQDYFFDSVNTILLFPGVVKRKRHDMPSGNIGEAWANGGIVLSWPDVRSIGRYESGHNVVIHEFAHHLDGLDGEMGGSIPFNNRTDQARWDEVSAQELQQLTDDIRMGHPTLLDAYGATNRAEFFAVASECFFELPHAMKQEHAELFDLLTRFYHVNPCDWQSHER